MKCPCTGVNIPRFLSATIAGMIALYAYEYFIHMQWLMPTYDETPELWRSYENAEDMAVLSFVRLFLVVATIGYLYTRNHEGKGAGEGLRYGLGVGAVLGVSMASSYLWMPISEELAIHWGLTGLGMGVVVGVIFSLLYSPCEKAKAKAAPAAASSAVKKTTAKKAPAKRKTAAKKTTAKKAPAKKKTAAKKTTAKKTTTKKTAAKKSTAKKAPAKRKTAAKKTTAKKAPAKKKTAAKKTTTKKTTRKTTKKK